MKTKLVVQLAVVTVIFSAFNFGHSIGLAQGTLTPPGAPAPVMKSLDQIEPRTPISGQVILTNSGSYYMTTNVTGNGGFGILIQADNVSIDLGGFILAGEPNPTSTGILVNGTHSNLTIYNGTIRNWGGAGLDASQGIGNRFESLKIFKNNGIGLASGNLSVVRGCSSSANNGDGIKLGANGLVVDSMAIGNSGKGIVIQDDCSIKNSIANANTNGGIFAGLNCIISQCVAVSNLNSTGDGSLGTGIVVSNNSSVVECMANYNSGNAIVLAPDCTSRGCTAFHNAGNGILVADNCRVVDNNVGINGNGFFGVAGIAIIGSGARIEGNLVNSNYGVGAGILSNNTSGNLLVRNQGKGNFLVDFSSSSANSAGPTINQSVTTGNFGTITNSNPWANFSN